MPRRRSDRSDQILGAARALLQVHGVADLTFESIARDLGVTKQAIIYWFRTKEELLGELHMLALADESEALAAAVRDQPPERAVRAMVRTLLQHHAARSWEEFRLLYMTAQLVPSTRTLLSPEQRAESVYPVTGAFYDSFEQALRPALGERARTAAVSFHLAAIGLATMSGLMDALGDQMRTPIPELAEVLTDRLVAGLPAPSGRATGT